MLAQAGSNGMMAAVRALCGMLTSQWAAAPPSMSNGITIPQLCFSQMQIKQLAVPPPAAGKSEGWTMGGG